MHNSDSSPTSIGSPHSREVEQEVVAAMLIHEEAVPYAATLLGADDFHVPRYRALFVALVAVHREHGLVDIVLLTDHLRETGDWERIGGAATLSAVLNRSGLTAHLAEYAAVLRSRSLQRRVMAAGVELEALGVEEDLPDEDRLERLDHVVRAVYRESGVTQLTDAPTCVAEHTAMVSEAEQRDGLVGMRTGLRRLDDRIGGLRPGWQVLVMAAAGVGKSAFAINNLALTAARDGHHVAIFSLEMTRAEVVGRMVSAVSGVPYHVQVRGRMDDKDRAAYEEGCEIIERLPVHVDEGDMLTIEQLGLRARALAHQIGQPLGMVVVDYLQLLEAGRRQGNRTEELSFMSRSLKRLAKEIGTVVVTLSQPTADGARSTRSGERDLTLADARGAQSIGADVDLALLLNRNDDTGRIRIEAGKYRHGPTFYLTEDDVRWHGGLMKFRDI